MGHGESRQGGARISRSYLRAGAGLGAPLLAALLLVGCASGLPGEGPETAAEGALVESSALPAAPVASPPASDGTAAATSRAAPAPTGRQKPPEQPYPSFGAPAQVGDRPVLTKEQRDAMQKNLEGLASQREKEMLRQIEADQ